MIESRIIKGVVVLARTATPLFIHTSHLHLHPYALSKGAALAVPLALVPMLAVFFWEVVSGEVFWGQRDAITLFLPTKFFLWDNLQQGKLPLWTPNMGAGFPLFAEGHLEGLNPLKLPFFLFLPFHLAYSYSVLFQLLIADISTWLYCRLIGMQRYESLLSAIVFTFSGFLIVHLIHLTVVSAIVWMPLVFYFLEKHFKENSNTAPLWAGAVLGIQFLGGHPGLMAILLMSYFLYIGFRSLDRRRPISVIYSFFGTSAAFLLTGLAIGAVQLVPQAELGALSVRSEPLPKFLVTYWSFPIPSLLTFFFPYFFGNDFSGDVFNGNYWGFGSTFQEATVYLGVLPLYLAVMRLLGRWDKYTLFFSILLVFSLIMAFGRTSPVYLLLSSLPGFDRLQAPGRFLILTSFSLAVLSGLGLQLLRTRSDDVIKRLNGRAVKIVAAMIGVFILIALYDVVDVIKQLLQFSFGPLSMLLHFSTRISPLSLILPILFIALVRLVLWAYSEGRISHAVFPILVVSIAFLDLFSFGRSYNRTITPTDLFDTPDTVQFLRQDTSLYRFFAVPYRKHFAPRYLFDPGDLAGNSGLLYQMNHADLDTPLSISRHAHLLSLIRLAKQQDSLLISNLNIADSMNIKYLLSDNYLANNELKLVYDDSRVKIYENQTVLPRAFVARNLKTFPEREAALEFMAGKDFEPRETLVLEADPESNLNVDLYVAPQDQDKVEVLEYQDDKVVVSAKTSTPGMLVLSDAYYPGWEAYIDGASSKIWRVNYAFRGVELPQGEHIITFVFRPTSVYIGAIITLAASLAFLGFIGFQFLNKRYLTKSKNADGQS